MLRSTSLLWNQLLKEITTTLPAWIVPGHVSRPTLMAHPYLKTLSLKSNTHVRLWELLRRCEFRCQHSMSLSCPCRVNIKYQYFVSVLCVSKTLMSAFFELQFSLWKPGKLCVAQNYLQNFHLSSILLHRNTLFLFYRGACLVALLFWYMAL